MSPALRRLLPNAALWAAFVLGGGVAAHASDPLDRAVGILKEVCADQAELTKSLAIAKAAAAKEGWSVVFEGPAPAPIMHGENGPKISNMGMWTIPLGPNVQVSLSVSAVDPERHYRAIPLSRPFKYDACFIKLPAPVQEDAIDRALAARFGHLLEKVVPARYVTPNGISPIGKRTGIAGDRSRRRGKGCRESSTL